MGNPLMAAMGGNMGQRGRRNLAVDLIRHIQGFRGNPIQILQSKLNSGEMTQDQYNQLRSMAQDIMGQMMSVLGK